jgi:FixJ family two-component response regulator
MLQRPDQMNVRNDEKLEITVVDDDASIRQSLRTLLRCEGWSVTTYASAEEFLEASSPDGPDCLILDIDLPGMSGLELQRRLTLREGRHSPIIFVTGRPDAGAHIQAIEGGAYAFFPKPVMPETLLRAVRSATQLVR